MTDAPASQPTTMLQHNLIEQHAPAATEAIISGLNLTDPKAYWTIRAAVTSALKAALQEQAATLSGTSPGP